jgi:hypothetical protein
MMQPKFALSMKKSSFRIKGNALKAEDVYFKARNRKTYHGPTA